MSKFRSPVDLQRNELRNAVLQKLPSGPATPVAGQMYYDSDKNAAYIWNGTNWIEWGVSPSGGANGRQFFLNLPFPRGNDDFAFVRVCEDLQVLRIDAALNTLSTSTLGFHVLSKQSLLDAGTPITEDPIEAVASGVQVTRFNNPLIAAHNWLVFKTMALSGDAAMFTLTITCITVPSSGTES